MTRRWSVRLLACLGVGAVVLTGCSEKQEASDSLPSSSSAAPSDDELPPLGPEDMPMPDEARTQDAAGAEAFVRYYVMLPKFLAESASDPQPLLDLSQGCLTCIRVVDSLREDLNAGYTYKQYNFTYTETGPALIQDDTAEVGFIYSQGPIVVVDANGQEVADRTTGPTGDLQSGAAVQWDEGRQTWLVTTLTVG